MSYVVSGRSALRYYVPLLVALGLVVAVEYVLEFVGAIDLSVGERFVRVARLQGMVLPIALLLVVSELVFAPRRWGRPLLLLLFIPIGLAFVLTVGRSMWAVFLIGLVCIAYMNGRLRGGDSRWRSAALVVAVLALLAGTVFSFQRFTGASIGAQVFERSRTLVEYEENVHVLGRIFSYAVALEASAEHPLLGHGQGKTLMLLNFNEDMLRFDWTRVDHRQFISYDIGQDGSARHSKFFLDVCTHYEVGLVCVSSIRQSASAFVLRCVFCAIDGYASAGHWQRLDDKRSLRSGIRHAFRHGRRNRTRSS